jgi:hypothetical protein
MLDVNLTWRRQRTQIRFATVMKKFKPNSHLTVVWRNYPNEYGEVCFTTMAENPEYFLWIHLREGAFIELIEKFKLELKEQ